MKTYEDYNIDLMGKSGAEVRVLCPECTPTRKKNKIKDLAVNTGLATWFCHHCGWKGGLSGSGKVYKRPEYKAETRLPEHVLKYFKDRGISESTLKTCFIGYGAVWMPAEGKEVNSIQFPFFKNGSVVNIKYRDGKKNFRQAKDAEKCFYGYDNMQNKSNTLIITEGEVDTLSFIEAGYTDVVSMPDGAPPENANNYTTKFDFLKSAEKKMSQYEKIIIATDNDGPGKLAENELSRRIGVEKCWILNYPDGCKDSNDVLRNFGSGKLKELVDKIRPCPVSGMFIPSDVKEKVKSNLQYGVERGALTGWNGIDQYYTVRPGELTIITGIPSSGKSNFLDCVMLNLMEKDWKFAIYSPENWPIDRHMQTLSEKLTGKSFDKKYNNYDRVSLEDVDAVTDYLDDRLVFLQPDEEKDEDPTIDKILELAKIALFRQGIRALVIDPWNEVAHDFGKMTETQYISKQLGRLRRFGRLNGVHIFVIAHPQKLQKNSKGKYDAPSMYDIAGGAHFRNKADNGICIHRTYNEGEEREVQIIVQKIRFRDIGTTGMHKLRFELATGKYFDDVQTVET